jgi:hypothetical protein
MFPHTEAYAFRSQIAFPEQMAMLFSQKLLGLFHERALGCVYLFLHMLRVNYLFLSA